MKRQAWCSIIEKRWLQSSPCEQSLGLMWAPKVHRWAPGMQQSQERAWSNFRAGHPFRPSSSIMQEAYRKPEGIFGFSIAREALQSPVWPLGVSRASVSACIHSKSWRSQQLRGWVSGSDPRVPVQGQSAWGVLLEQILQLHLIQKGAKSLTPESPCSVIRGRVSGGNWDVRVESTLQSQLKR